MWPDGIPSQATRRQTLPTLTNLRSRRADFLRSVGLPGHLARRLAKQTRCECGVDAVAVGVFYNLGPFGGRVINAMLLCAEHAGMVDRQVEIYVMGEDLIHGCAPAGGRKPSGR